MNIYFDLFRSGFKSSPPPSQQFSSTLPPSQCVNGFPIDEYAGSGINTWEVLYSAWVYYQNTLGAQFTYNQALIKSPNNLLNPPIGPANVFIIRHGEKNTSSEVRYSLNNNGVYRACQLTNFINQLAEDGYPISYIITTNPCPYNSSSSSMRNEQTCNLASFLLNIPLYIFGGGSDVQLAVDRLFSTDVNNPFNGLNVLMVWEHSAIQSLMVSFIDTAHDLAIPRSSLAAIPYFDAINASNNSPCIDGNYKAATTIPGVPETIIPSEANPAYAEGPDGYENIPYWNDKNFNNVFWFKSNSDYTDFDFYIFDQPCITCYPSCNLAICLYQPPKSGYCVSSYKYYNSDNLNIEQECKVPTLWSVN
jgi:hypothetical protein